MSCFICWGNPTIPPNASINMKAFTTKWSNNIKIGEQIPMIVQYKMSIESWMVMYFQNVLVRNGGVISNEEENIK